jgi:hypothetical protein
LLGEPCGVLGAIARDERDRIGTEPVLGHAVTLARDRQGVGHLLRRERDERDLAWAATDDVVLA